MTREKAKPEPRDNDTALDKELAHEDIQHGEDQSIPKQEQLKQHPARDLPRVESIEPPETPPRI
jgi:hypothetical protein